MELAAIRRLRTRQIIDNDFGGVECAFAAHIGKAPTTTYRWFTDKVAHKRNIGEKTARLIEKKCAKPALWLDAPLDTSDNLSAKPSVRQRTDTTITLLSSVFTDKLSARISDQEEAHLISWYRRSSVANKRRLYLQAELYCLVDNPEIVDDSMEGIGIRNLLKKEKSGTKRDKHEGVSRSRHNKTS